MKLQLDKQANIKISYKPLRKVNRSEIVMFMAKGWGFDKNGEAVVLEDKP